MAQDGLTDTLKRWDPKSQEIAYNNFTDRFRFELPPAGDPAASGVVSLNIDTLPASGLPVSVDRWNGDSLMVWSASGTSTLPVYLDSPIPVTVSVDIETDSIKVFSSSGTPSLPVYLVSDLDRSNDSVTSFIDKTYSSISAWSASGSPSVDVHLTDVAFEEDRHHVSGDRGIPALAVRVDGIGSLVGTDGDYANLQLSAYGGIRAQLDTVRDVAIDIGNGFADTGTIRVAVASGVLNQERDNVRVYSASGTSDIPVYLQSDLDFNNDSVKSFNVSSSGTPDIPVYIQGSITASIPGIVEVKVDQSNDSIRLYSASGSAAVETWINNEPVEIQEQSILDKQLVQKRFTYNAQLDVATIKEAPVTSPSGAACKLQTFYYNSENDVDYIIDSLSTW